MLSGSEALQEAADEEAAGEGSRDGHDGMLDDEVPEGLFEFHRALAEVAGDVARPGVTGERRRWQVDGGGGRAHVVLIEMVGTGPGI